MIKTSLTSILFIALLLSSLHGIGQKKYKKVKRQISRSHKEIYQLNKENKTKEGYYYLINTMSKDTLITGNYSNDKRTGNWKFNQKQSAPYIEYNYDEHLLTSYKSDNKIDSTFIKKGDKYVIDRVENPQLYIGFKDQVLYDLMKNIKLPKEIIDNEQSGLCMYSFVISKDGILKDIRVEQSLDKKLDKNVINSISELNYTWEPAKKDGNPVDSKSFLFIEIANNQEIPENNLNKAYFWHLTMAYYTTTTVKRIN